MKRILKKALLMILIISVIAGSLAVIAFAHPGRTDGSGGHYDQSTGEYHYHHGHPAHDHINGICPYKKSDETERVHVVLDNNAEDKPNAALYFLISVAVIVVIVAVVLICLHVNDKRKVGDNVTNGKDENVRVVRAVLLAILCVALWFVLYLLVGTILAIIFALLCKIPIIRDVVMWLASVYWFVLVCVVLTAFITFAVNEKLSPNNRTENVSKIITSAVMLLCQVVILVISIVNSSSVAMSIAFIVICAYLIFESVNNLKTFKVKCNDADIQS